MGIEAKQSGSQVNIKSGNHSTSVTGKLIGYTSKAVFVVSGQNVHVYVEKGGSFGGVGTQITLNGGEAVMCGNCVGIKKNGRINLYDENGRPAGSKNA
jgi:hypothetical protein